jgi:SAM-dependent methyltransferase
VNAPAESGIGKRKAGFVIEHGVVETFWNDIHATVVNPVDATAIDAAVQYFGDLRGKTVLDLGCGPGLSSLLFASRGADVIAVDISEVAIATLSETCAANGITNVHPFVCAALEIERYGPVDYVFGNCILHHIEPFDRFVEVLDRSLAPGGKAFFRENNGSLKALMWARDHLVGRFGIPRAGDGVEHPLTPGELAMLRGRFALSRAYPFMFLFELAATHVFRRRFYPQCRALDRFAYRFPALRPLSYYQDIALQRLR